MSIQLHKINSLKSICPPLTFLTLFHIWDIAKAEGVSISVTADSVTIFYNMEKYQKVGHYIKEWEQAQNVCIDA